MVLGQALPGPAQARIVAVTISGVGFQPATVDALDAAGNFFTSVNVALGLSTLSFTAIDELGQTATTTLDLEGLPAGPGIDTSGLREDTLDARLSYQSTTFNRRSRTLRVDARLTNQAATGLGPFVLAAYAPFDPLAVQLGNGEGTIDDAPYVNFDTDSPTVTDPDGDMLTFSLETAPAGMTIDADTGQVTFLAPADGNYNVSILADDSNGGSAVQAYTLRVGDAGPANGSPIISSTPGTEATVDSLYLYLPQAADPDGDTLSYSLLSAPAGMQLLLSPAGPAGEGGVRLEWTPDSTQLGPQPILLVVEDGNGGSASQSFTVVVSDVPPNQPPVITSSPSRLATQDEPYSYEVDAVDPEATTLTYGLTNPPAGMTIDSATGQLTWTPTSSDLGGNPVTVTATDAAGLVATQTYSLEVREPNTAPVFESSPVLEVSAGGNYRYDVVATDAEDAVSYSLESAPSGMDIGQTNGILFWRTGLADVGDHAITIRATDERGLFADQSYTLSVAPDTTPPLVTVSLQSYAGRRGPDGADQRLGQR